MTEAPPQGFEGEPYAWNVAPQEPPPEPVLALWQQVGEGLEKSQTVVWKSAVESLQATERYLSTSEDSRCFAEKYTYQIIGILVEQYPGKIGNHERTCVQESLSLATSIVAKDLEIQLQRKGQSKLLNVLALLFNKKKAYYKGNKTNWNNHGSGLPEVRLAIIDRFRQLKGFSLLDTYMTERMKTKDISFDSSSHVFPNLETLHQILTALGDSVPVRVQTQRHAAVATETEDDVIFVATTTMEFIDNCSDEDLKKIPVDTLTALQTDLRRIFDRLVATRRGNTYEFYAFWRGLILRLIKSPSLLLRLFGWQQMDEMLDAVADHRPPPRYFDVSEAGCDFVNGRYSFIASTTPDGYATRGTDISYERRIPASEGSAPKNLTLFRCTMRSQQKWWFLSEADEEQPGTDRDIDYYQHKSKEHEEIQPPPHGWVTCRNSGMDPPPQLQSVGLMVPSGEEYNTLEHQLAEWACRNGIIKLVLGDSAHREIVARSTPLIHFLASMCTRDDRIQCSGSKAPNQYCLELSDLLLAWDTCSRKTDAAVSTQVHQLLVSILPECPENLAIPLLKTMQESLTQGKEKGGDLLGEVAEFCAALAAANSSDVKAASTIDLEDSVRAEVLELLWSVLTHGDAASLKVYDALKNYVTNELRVEPKGSEHREKYLLSCIQILTKNAESVTKSVIDEQQALRIVKLTDFVLAACPRQQAAMIVTRGGGALASLLLNELIAALRRQKDGDSTELAANKPTIFLSDRLAIIRYVYGLSDSVWISEAELGSMWELCDSPELREQLMIFIASASVSKPINNSLVNAAGPITQTEANQDDVFSVFTETTARLAFMDLFCSEKLSYQSLGEGAYQSFQTMFNRVRDIPSHGRSATVAAIDTLWRICLQAGSDNVASKAMDDLLAIYVAIGAGSVSIKGEGADSMETEPSNDNFGQRVFDCLSKIQTDLRKEDCTAMLAIERCLRILKAAVGQGDSSKSTSASILSRLINISDTASLDDIFRMLPQEMRGQACYRRVNVMAKHTQTSQPPEGDIRNPRFFLDVHPLETVLSIKMKVAAHCKCPLASIKIVSITGRKSVGEQPQGNAQDIKDDSTVDEERIVHGCELVFVLTEEQQQQSQHDNLARVERSMKTQDLSDIFYDDRRPFPGKIFDLLLAILETLPRSSMEIDNAPAGKDAHKLVWDLLLAMPTNLQVASDVTRIAHLEGDDAMEVDPKMLDEWPKLLDLQNLNRSVYVLLVIDAFLEPAIEVLSTLPSSRRSILESKTVDKAVAFRHGFIRSGGFEAVVQFLSRTDSHPEMNQSMTRMGNAVALRILKCCLFGNGNLIRLHEGTPMVSLDEAGIRLKDSLSNSQGLLHSLTSMVVKDSGISTTTISDILKFLELLFQAPSAAQKFICLPNGIAEKFVMSLLLWDVTADKSRPHLSASSCMKVRSDAKALILSNSILGQDALPWLTKALNHIDVTSEATSEFFEVLLSLVTGRGLGEATQTASSTQLQELGVVVCGKLIVCSRSAKDTSNGDNVTGVLCGCLAMLRAIMETTKGDLLETGTTLLVKELNLSRWSEAYNLARNVNSATKDSKSEISQSDTVLIDLMGIVFDAFLSPGASTMDSAVCCEKESRQRGFDVIAVSARSCDGPDGYFALVSKIDELITIASPFLKHHWGQHNSTVEHQRNHGKQSSKYSGLRNQGCTCYMNSFLQQMFMMPELRSNLCSATLPSSLRSTAAAVTAKGADLVGRKIALQWDNGVSYDARVESFDKETGMHTIRYCPVEIATVGASNNHQPLPDSTAALPENLPEELFLSQGRPGKETGVFEMVNDSHLGENDDLVGKKQKNSVDESEDEIASRHLLEEVQRTFIHLDEGSRGRCFDPRALVEASACLKLEFDVWQQNDASEFATKLLDRLETSLKRWAPDHFRYLDHTFGLKQTKQKICKECGLKTNREEKLLNVDCQIRGKSDIHEALGSMTEVEIMEGDNQVFCDQCKRNTDTILRTAISTLPNMLILSLKRFDLDFTTFETVKLNSRCAFGQKLNMKQYTLEGLEATERQSAVEDSDDMDTGTDSSSVCRLVDEDYEYKLAGVLVHAGVAQGGHYYSFIKDRNLEAKDQWYRFDDEDVTPFDPGCIETECFGGKVKKETKWPNGQVQTVESEQYANALMLFYEKVKPTETPPPSANEQKDENARIPSTLQMASGFEAFEPDVKKSNVTHQWQAFLFDTEFIAFLKGLLGLCRIRDETTDLSWKASVVQMLITFYFDVLLHSNERVAMVDWVEMLEDILQYDISCGFAFIEKLALKTKEVGGNWLRTFLSDCPDPTARSAAVQLFCASFQTSLTMVDKRKDLDGWTAAWREQMDSLSMHQGALPCSLESDFQSFEDSESNNYSPLGTILSHVNVLIEASTRSSRYFPEANIFLRNLAACGDQSVKNAIIEAQIPARMICSVVRDRAPPSLRAAFPGSSMAVEIAETQIRPETTHASGIMSLSGNHAMNTSDGNHGRSVGTPLDYLPLFEALAFLLDIRGLHAKPLIVGDRSLGNQGSKLSEEAIGVLTQLFAEWCAPGAAGMGKQQIDMYLQRCGIDSTNLAARQIADLMAKYPTSHGNLLSLDGFLAYYQNMAQSSDSQLRHDLNVHGFRFDLSRRPRERRQIEVQGRERPATSSESIMMDVFSYSDSSSRSLGKRGDLGLRLFDTHARAYTSNEIVAEHLLAATVYRGKTSALLLNTLRAITEAPTGWAGNGILSAAIMVLRGVILVSDDQQMDRIALMMQCNDPPAPQAEYGIGLLVAARAFYDVARQAHTYPNEFSYTYERYVRVLKELIEIQSVFDWMNENRLIWAWMERDLIENSDLSHDSHRSDYGGRRDDTVPGVPQSHQTPPDSDGIPGMQDSEDEDDSRFEDSEPTYSHGPGKVVVKGAGNPAVNGIYVRDGFHERASKFSRSGEYDGKSCVFSLFQCNVSNNTKHWYLSIVPPSNPPGTNEDTDFYSAPVTETCIEFPPLSGWSVSPEGREPPPLVSFVDMMPEDEESDRLGSYDA